MFMVSPTLERIYMFYAVRCFEMLWVITVYEPDAAEWVDPKARRVIK